MQVIRLTVLLAASAMAAAQAPNPAPPIWQMQDSGTTSGLRGIYSVDGTVACASGTRGTVLRTLDGGAHWQKCAVPDAATDGATLDFRGVQAWDANTAIIMSSGKGKLSRLYKTTDGCRAWKLVFTNPDPEGFFDSLNGNIYALAVLGDPVNRKFSVFYSTGGGNDWARYTGREIPAAKGEAAFAASNLSMLPPTYTTEISVRFISGGQSGAYLHSFRWHWIGDLARWQSFEATKLPMGGTATSGAFAVAMGCDESGFAKACPIVVVGGDFLKPDEHNRTAAFGMIAAHSQNFSQMKPAQIPPHGYRSAVQWSDSLKLWITAGTNGSDISRDDGKTWQPLDNGNWNALSLPFVVGPNGRIARLNPAAIPSGSNLSAPAAEKTPVL